MLQIRSVHSAFLISDLLLVLFLAGCNLPAQVLPIPAYGQTPSPQKSSTVGTIMKPISTQPTGTPESFMPANNPTPSATASPSSTPSVTPTTTPTVPSPTPVLPVIEGSLDELIVQLEADAPRQGTQGFSQPDEQSMDDFKHLVEQLFPGNLAVSVDLASRHGYELVRYHDPEIQDTDFYVLRELRPIQRAWGLYIFNLDACRDLSHAIIVQAPHILADEGTPQIALDAFRALDACALMIAGAHRDSNTGGIADVAHNPQTVYQSVQTALADAAGQATLVLQIHGFAAWKHPGYPSIILGDSPADDPAGSVILAQLSQNLVEQGLLTGVCDGSNWTSLCGETNVLANSLQAGLFIHMEMDEVSRSEPGKLIDSLAAVLLTNP